MSTIKTTEPVRQRRPRRKVLTDNMVAALPRRSAAYFFSDPELPKHGVRVRPSGPGTYTVITRDPYKKQRWIRIGNTAEMLIGAARAKARSVIERVEQGLEPFEPPPVKPDSVANVAANWLARHVDKKGLRTAKEQHRIVARYVLPHWAKRDFLSIRRRDVTELLDHVEDHHGARTSDAVATLLSSVARWYADNGYAPDDYVSPFGGIKQRGRRKRNRTLSDDELRAVWRAADGAGAFGALVKLLLLTAQRREKVLTMKWSDVDLKTGVWTIPREDEREKGTPDQLQLPAQALAVLSSLPRFVGNGFVFANRGFNSRQKRALDEASGVTAWVLHDCRRTSRSLLSKAGVRPDVAELCLGHAIGGVREIYDRYDFAGEMADALRRLAALIEIILAGEPTDDIAKLRAQIDSKVGTPITNVVKLRSSATVS